MDDYRNSHQEESKGKTYAESFSKNNNKRFIWEWEKEVLAEIGKQFVNDRHNENYLDFACGTGRITAFLEPYFKRTVGVDVSESMLGVARNNVENADLRLIDLTRTNPFEPGEFALISAFRFFVNAQDELRAEVMKQLASVLAPDGRLVFNVHINSSSPFCRIVKLRKFLLRDKRDDFRSMSLTEVQELLHANNLAIEKIYHKGLIPIFDDDSEVPPFRAIGAFERFVSGIPALARVSRYLIFVCRKI